MDTIFDTYFNDTDADTSKELEYRYTCSKQDYDDCIQYATNHYIENGRQTSLNILLDNDVRITINEPVIIEQYCQNNLIPMRQWSNVLIGIKTTLSNTKRDNGSKVELSNESEFIFSELVQSSDADLSSFPPIIQSIIKEARITSKIELIGMPNKIFRLRQRISFKDAENLIRIDITKVKENGKTYDISGRHLIQTTNTMKDAKLNSQPLKYEFEIEALEKSGDMKHAFMEAISAFEKVIGKDITKNPLPPLIMKEYGIILRELVQQHYDRMSASSDDIADFPKSSVDAIQKYVGTKTPYVIPKLVSASFDTLPLTKDAAETMTVTDKADGESCLVMVMNGVAHVFDVSFTYLGMMRFLPRTEDLPKMACLFAGEFISKDVGGLPHDTAYLYDCYLWEGKDIRHLNLMNTTGEPSRMDFVNKFAKYSEQDEPSIGSGIRIRAKKMRIGNLVENAKAIWSKKHTYPYVLDGIIITPAYAGVGQTADNTWEWGFRMNRTWSDNIKWKPPQYNSVDFILSWKSKATRSVKQGIVRKGELRTTEMIEQNGVKAIAFPLFQPSEYPTIRPYEIEVPLDSRNDPRTEEDSKYIRNHSIVECRYDSGHKRWVVMRNRDDKTVAWDKSMETMAAMKKRFRILINVANQIKTSSKSGSISWKQWGTKVKELITIGARKRRISTKRVSEYKKDKLNEYTIELAKFLTFHSIIDQTVMNNIVNNKDVGIKTLVMTLLHSQEKIYELLDTHLIPLPFNYTLAASNATFVAHSIWNSIHNPLTIDDIVQKGERTGPASGAGEDVVGETRSVTPILTVPVESSVSNDITAAIYEYLTKSLNVKHDSTIEISDAAKPMIQDSYLWTTQVDLRPSDSLFRGDPRKPKSGWFSKQDKMNFLKRKPISHVLCFNIWGSAQSAKERRGIVDSITMATDTTKPTRALMYYWDAGKIAKLATKVNTTYKSGKYEYKRIRGGHLEYSFEGGEAIRVQAVSEEKMMAEFQSKGWKSIDSAGLVIDAILEKDPITSCLSIIELDRVSEE